MDMIAQGHGQELWGVNTIELTVHASCYCILDLLCVNFVLFFCILLKNLCFFHTLVWKNKFLKYDMYFKSAFFISCKFFWKNLKQSKTPFYHAVYWLSNVPTIIQQSPLFLATKYYKKSITSFSLNFTHTKVTLTL